MKHLHRFDCSKLEKSAVEQRINEYVCLGWEFTGYSDFPLPHKWACFTWSKDKEPMYPASQEEHT